MYKFLFFILSLLIFAGCSVKKPEQTIIVKKLSDKELKYIKPYKYKYRPVVGSRTNDARVIIDQGVVLKALVNTYKVGRNTLIPSNHMYIRVEAPDFIPQYTVPPKYRKRSGVLSQNYGKVPFMIGSEEVDRSSLRTNEGIKNYVNSVYEKNSIKEEKKKRSEVKKFDSTIKEFLKNKEK